MPGRMVLAGGNEFRTGCEEMDRAILRAAGPAPARVLIVPTAAVTGPQKAAQDGVRHFARLGADSSELMVLDRTHADDHGYARELEGATMIYFTGGQPRSPADHPPRLAGYTESWRSSWEVERSWPGPVRGPW